MSELGHITIILIGFSGDFGGDRKSDESWHDWFFRKIDDTPDLKKKLHNNHHEFKRTGQDASFTESKKTDIEMTPHQFKTKLDNTTRGYNEILLMRGGLSEVQKCMH